MKIETEFLLVETRWEYDKDACPVHTISTRQLFRPISAKPEPSISGSLEIHGVELKPNERIRAIFEIVED